MPVAPNNPHSVGSTEWFEYNTPGIFDASKNKTAAQTAEDYRTRVQAGEVQADPNKSNYGQHNYPSSYGAAQPTSYGGSMFFDSPQTMYSSMYGTNPPPPGGYPSGGGGGGGGGGGYGSPAPIDFSQIMGLLNRKPQQYQWQDAKWAPYQAQDFYKFDTGMYDTMRSGLTDAIAADRSAGDASYAQGLGELQQYQNPFNSPNAITNPEQSAAMQRMMQANGVATDINQADTNRGVQADQAFGNLLSILGSVNDQAQASRVRALQGDQRGFGERLDAEQRGGTLAVNMQQAAAQRQYEIDKWTFGEGVARKNYDDAMQNIYYNNQGQNQTAQQNVQANNTWNQGNIQTLIDIIASGGEVDPSAYVGA